MTSKTYYYIMGFCSLGATALMFFKDGPVDFFEVAVFSSFVWVAVLGLEIEELKDNLK